MRKSSTSKMSASTTTSRKTTLTTAEKLVAISERLRRGDVTAIAQRTGFDVSYVSRVLNGKRNPSAAIVNDAYKAVRRRKVTA